MDFLDQVTARGPGGPSPSGETHRKDRMECPLT
jgi:hypothetical protein